MIPRTHNKRAKTAPKNAVYIGRPSKWGNPFEIGKDGDRNTVIEKYRRYLEHHPELLEAARRELHGKDLVCWCAPAACHGDVLIEVANANQCDER